MSPGATRPRVGIVTPALADANNGNWQTARRWSRMLSGTCRVHLLSRWPDEEAPELDVLLALHARRSASSIAAWAERHPKRPLIVALTGTDLYRDILTDASAQRSLQLANRLVVLQEAGPLELTEPLRAKCRVVFQSSTSRLTLGKSLRHLRVVVVGHLRSEKSPQTVWEIAQRLTPQDGITLDHLGVALDPALGEAAIATMQACPHYRWLGGVSHAQSRRQIQRAHLLLHPSQMEGGAHVVMEAITCGTPVLASKVAGNIGMLGVDYDGYFDWGDAAAATELLRECRRSQIASPDGQAPRLTHLQAQCALRAPLFAPEREAAELCRLVHESLNPV
ncbi:MAG: selenoneine biosynthesis selenosugar synthase SenB [Alphaproteobacteria bacterium]|nr:selenoneine biosynthesis selenosugar synthase SenB [Alphaproteobacteria bacterium]